MLVVWGVAGCASMLPAQKCYDYACMIEKAKQYIREKNFEAALNSATAAKRYSNVNESEADALIKEMFIEINQLRMQAEEAKAAAQKATLEAENSAKVAEVEKIKARKAEADANRQRDSVVAARALVEELIKKGETLENTFSDSSAYDYLYQTGLKYFEWDKVTQSRDYQNALTYFALARFLKPSDTLGHLVFASKTGIQAEADFIQGNLDSARYRYLLIQAKVDSTSRQSDFEQWRLQQIKEVKNLYELFRQKHRVHTIIPDTLKGNWWTIPSDFKQYQHITTLVFKDNPVTFRQFPSVLDSLPELRSLTIINCPEVRRLANWQGLLRLGSLSLKNNANLYSLEKLEKLEQLSYLNIDNCPALTHVSGCEKLEHFAIRRSPQARVSALLQTNEKLKDLELADLPEDSLNSENLYNLESLSLARMNIRNLQGLGQNGCLRALKIDELNQLQSFTPPSCLSAAYISDCDRLIGLNEWPKSDSLNKLMLYKNGNLQNLPDWQHFSNLKYLLILNNSDITTIKGIKSLKNTEQLYILNNPNLIVNSIHAGFGFEWGIDLTSIKLEFEHRRTVKWLKNQDFGFKAVALYAYKKFEDDALYTKRKTKGYIGGFVINYYSPYLIYAGAGIGLGRTESLFADQSRQRRINFVWINNLGFQFAPYFLKKDKVSINMDLYTIFEKDDYYILPSFGLTYYYTLGFNNKTHFIRPGDSRRHIIRKWHRERIEDLPETF